MSKGNTRSFPLCKLTMAFSFYSSNRQERELITWQNITQLQRETIVLEISDLVHRQLVTSALESDFRRHLERNVLVSTL